MLSTCSMPHPARRTSQPRILVDTNVWRYLVDLDGLETVYRAAKEADGQILACPAVLYEMLRFEDAPLRRRLVKAICRARWVRMMPEAFEESSEFRAEIARLRPSWLLSMPDFPEYNKLYNDWNGSRGAWWRARTNPTQASETLRAVEGDELQLGRIQAFERRSDIGKIAKFETVRLDKWTTTFPLKPPGWDGNPVETWRVETMGYYIDSLLTRKTDQSDAPREWLKPWINIAAMQNDLSSFAKLFLYETDASHFPRSWLRWALRTLQATRKTSPGTPVDNQIGSYLVDADFLLTADKVFAAIVQRVAKEAVVQVAAPVLTSADTCVSMLTALLRKELLPTNPA
jgi:hypothetical protein